MINALNLPACEKGKHKYFTQATLSLAGRDVQRTERVKNYIQCLFYKLVKINPLCLRHLSQRERIVLGKGSTNTRTLLSLSIRERIEFALKLYRNAISSDCQTVSYFTRERQPQIFHPRCSLPIRERCPTDREGKKTTFNIYFRRQVKINPLCLRHLSQRERIALGKGSTNIRTLLSLSGRE